MIALIVVLSYFGIGFICLTVSSVLAANAPQDTRPGQQFDKDDYASAAPFIFLAWWFVVPVVFIMWFFRVFGPWFNSAVASAKEKWAAKTEEKKLLLEEKRKNEMASLKTDDYRTVSRIGFK